MNGKNGALQTRKRLMVDDVVSGIDELGVLLMGNAKGIYWYGSRLSIDQARKLAPYNNATSLQVTAAVLSGMIWAIENPSRGIVEPEQMDFIRVLEIATPYLGDMAGVWGAWTPLQDRGALFPEDIDPSDPWQFKKYTRGIDMSVSTVYARHFIACNRHDLGRFVPLSIGGKRYGFVMKTLADFLLHDVNSFIVSGNSIELHPALATYAARTAALAKATQDISAHYSKALRNELYPVIGHWGDEPVAEIDRAAVPWFGVRAWGVHVNGFVRKAGGLHLWIGERAADRPADPGKLDNLIGGGQPIGLTVEENLCKEAQEEAGIDAPLALTAKAVRTLDYRVERNDGLRSDTLFIYDLELPVDFMPHNTDGEVASFRLLPIAEVAALVRDTDRFKFNCNIVIIDFLMRHGFLTPQDAEYAELMPWVKG